LKAQCVFIICSAECPYGNRKIVELLIVVVEFMN